MAESTSSVQVPDPYRLELVTSDGSRSEAVDNVLRAVALGFHLSQPSDAELEHYAACVEGEQLWTIRQPDPDPEFPNLPVATMDTYPSTINTGHGHLEPATFITDVTVRASHRRRGLLRTLMTNTLTRSKEEGLAFAALTATEGSIYGRFGYGISTRDQSVEIVVDGRFKLNHAPSGTVSMADPLAIDDLRLKVFSEFHRARRGSHNRQPWHVDYASGRWDPRRAAQTVASVQSSITTTMANPTASFPTRSTRISAHRSPSSTWSPPPRTLKSRCGSSSPRLTSSR